MEGDSFDAAAEEQLSSNGSCSPRPRGWKRVQNAGQLNIWPDVKLRQVL
jgi:hypothetical protein